MTRNARPTGLLRSLVAAARSEQITFLAASLAYYAFVSLIPLLLLVLVVTSVFGGERLAARLVNSVGTVLSPTGRELLQAALTGAAGRGGATVVGVLVLVWGGLKVFRGLDIAFSQVYGTGTEETFLLQLRDAAVTLVAVGGGVVLSVVTGVFLTTSGLPTAGIAGTFVPFLTLVLAFLPLYVILPDANVSVREALPGTVLAAGGWTVLGTGFRVYADLSTGFAIYGVIGAVLLLVTLFYFAGIVLLLGAVLNAVLSDRADDRNRQLQQEPPRGVAQRPSMTDDQGGTPAPSTDDTDTGGSRDREEELAQLRADLEAFEEEIEDRTVHRDELESDLKRYVRRRVRRGHARGWGPYLVLLYGTVMTLGAFATLNGGWAILAMIVVWLSTLGLYTLMVLVGLTSTALGVPGRLRDRVQDFRR